VSKNDVCVRINTAITKSERTDIASFLRSKHWTTLCPSADWHPRRQTAFAWQNNRCCRVLSDRSLSFITTARYSLATRACKLRIRTILLISAPGQRWSIELQVNHHYWGRPTTNGYCYVLRFDDSSFFLLGRVMQIVVGCRKQQRQLFSAQ